MPGGSGSQNRPASVAFHDTAVLWRRSYFLFFPVLGTQKRLHAHNGIGIRFYPRVLRGSHVVDEQIVVSPLQVEVCGESFLLVEEFLPVGQVTPDAHVGAACQGKSQIAHGSEQIVECRPFVQPAFAAFVAAVSQHHLVRDVKLRAISRSHWLLWGMQLALVNTSHSYLLALIPSVTASFLRLM